MFNSTRTLMQCLNEHDAAKLRLDILDKENDHDDQEYDNLHAVLVRTERVLTYDVIDTIRQLVRYAEYLETQVGNVAKANN